MDVNWLHVIENGIAIAGAVVTTLLPLAPVLIPLAGAMIKDEKTRRAFEAVSQAGLLGTNAALHATNTALAIAKVPGSPGGTDVTPDELRQAIQTGVMAGKQWLKENNTFDQVVGVYGGEEALGQALAAFVSNKLLSHAAGPTVTTQAPVVQ